MVGGESVLEKSTWSQEERGNGHDVKKITCTSVWWWHWSLCSFSSYNTITTTRELDKSRIIVESGLRKRIKCLYRDDDNSHIFP